jgi:universal stress protein E
MGKKYQRIVLVSEATHLSEAAEQTALNLAKQHGASVHVVATVNRPSIAAQWLTKDYQDIYDMVVNDKRERLDATAERFRNEGIPTDVDVLCGKSSEEIVKLVLTEEVDLVIRYMKGEMSRQKSVFGDTARNLMRICPRPILFVREGMPIDQAKVLACVNAEHGPEENQPILAAACQLAGESKQLQALYCWNFYGSEMMQHYLDKSRYEQCLQEAEHIYQGLHEKFVKSNDLTAFQGGVHLENGEPKKVIPELCKRESVDVVVMSSASQNHPIRRLLGSTIESVLDELPCSLLVVKPTGFKSPIKVQPPTKC